MYPYCAVAGWIFSGELPKFGPLSVLDTVPLRTLLVVHLVKALNAWKQGWPAFLQLEITLVLWGG